MTDNDDGAQRREQPEPTEGDRPVPRAVLLLVAGLVVWGTGYIVAHTGWPLAGGDSRTPVAVADNSSVSGETVYNNTCAACHQAGGTGIPGSFPPLADSDWVTGEPTAVVAIVSHGLQGDIEVGGETYSGAMPAFGGQLSNREIAAVASYVRSSWGNEASAVDTETVESVRSDHDGRGPWTADELRTAFGGPDT
ncbi:cytochrome c [Aquisalimonas lutea]|uniref:c-type cytochrome n=1 Tax=Aquisalimonas lutea TaxID=1327750 RepID=UPI0025B59642|nr:cytochrome c [Aquisalimonas lutea]MDN3519888.1 cytochrome c [Aquisalimonas lutea]